MNDNFIVRLKLPFEYTTPKRILDEYKIEQEKIKMGEEIFPHRATKLEDWKNLEQKKCDPMFNPIFKLLDNLGLYVPCIDSFYSSPCGGGTPAHSDCVLKLDSDRNILHPKITPSLANLNIYFGAENCLTRFWKIKKDKLLPYDKYYDKFLVTDKEKIMSSDSDGKPLLELAYHFEQNDLELITEFKTAGICLLNPGEIHSTYNPDPIGRWCVSAPVAKKGEKEQICFEEAKELFSDYIDYES